MLDNDIATITILAVDSETPAITPEELRSLSRRHFWFLMSLGLLLPIGATLEPVTPPWGWSILGMLLYWGYMGFMNRDLLK